MTKPTTEFKWDSNGTNTSAITAGHKTDGYGFSEVPTSAELNEQFKEIAAWIKWFSDSGNRHFYLHQNWRDPMWSAWTATTAGGGAVTASIDGSTATRLGTWLSLATSASADVAGKYSEVVVAGNQATQRAVAEFRVDSTAIAGTGAHAFRAGWASAPTLDETSTGTACKISKTSANANWFFVTYSSAGVATSTDTGVAATGVQSFRIEMIGANDAGGARALLYINGTLVATHTTNLPDCPTNADRMTFGSYLKNVSAGAVSTTVYVSPMTMFLDYL